ncbi:MAG: hypothetical protein A2W25_05095 [candidate division Zixibacteria bacterium RBG_16_53_22]|nr:MAG: hypothetical protein A2W25_05095 [candidate division Zixibacteria bacterium RBG_16_53_22]
MKKNSGLLKSIMLVLGIIVLLMIPLSVARAAGPLQESPPPFDLIEFLKTAGIIFVPMLSIVFGVVNYIGKLGVKGKWQLASSLIAGLLLGGLVMYFTTLPNTAVGWFSVALFGLLVGLAASGCYEGIRAASAKGAESITIYDRFPK